MSPQGGSGDREETPPTPRAGSRGHELAGGAGQGTGEGSWAQTLWHESCCPSEEVPMETRIPWELEGTSSLSPSMLRE